MAENKQTTFWPYMILGFLFVGITLGYWTVQSASSLPVQESNDYMLKYQTAELEYNDIMEKKAAFDERYEISLPGREMIVVKDNVNSKLPPENSVKLEKGINHFIYTITKHDGSVILDANVTFVLTRPHTGSDDVTEESVPYVSGEYRVKDINITKPGRYILQLRAKVGDTVGYSEMPAYLKP